MSEEKLVDTPIGKIKERRVTEAEWTELERRISAVESAFPSGPLPHREYHQAKENAAREEAEFWKAAKLELTKVGVSTVFGIVKLIGMLALLGILYKMGLGNVASAIGLTTGN